MRGFLIRSCPGCGRELETWRDPAEPGDYLVCGLCAVLWEATGDGVARVELAELEDGPRAIVRDLIALYWRDRFDRGRLRAAAARQRTSHRNAKENTGNE